MKRRFYIVAFYPEKESKLILTALVCADDVEIGSFTYTQEIAIDGEVYDVDIIGTKLENGICVFEKVYKIPYKYPFDKDGLYTCEIITAIPQDFDC